MSLYTVTEPCVIGQLHYATVPAQPIEVDDELAAPLVEAGSLVPYRAAVVEEPALVSVLDTDPPAEAIVEPVEKPRRPRKAAED